MVRAQAMLLDHLGIESLFCVAGGSMGGMQVLQWAASYPERVFSALPIATAARHSAQNIAFHEVGRQAIMADPEWRGGDYAAKGTQTRARGWRSRAWRRTSPICRKRRCTGNSGAICRTATRSPIGFDADFQVESYLRHQGLAFVDRFDANSYLYITRAMDYFDLAADYGGVLAQRVSRHEDALLRRLVHLGLAVPDGGEPEDRACAERGRGANVSFVEIDDRQGPRRVPARRAGVSRTLRGFIDAAARQARARLQ